jgi:hypothetical protein
MATNKRHITDTSLCGYCRSDLFPHGKIFVPFEDKLARRTSKGDWKCGTCVLEDMRKATKLLNRHKGIIDD